VKQFCDISSLLTNIGKTDPFCTGLKDFEVVCSLTGFWLCKALYALLRSIWLIVAVSIYLLLLSRWYVSHLRLESSSC
jgi:hypothetical protein